MFKLRDFFPIPQVSGFVKQILSDGPGLVMVAGYDLQSRAPCVASDEFLPSGRAAIFRALMDEVLSVNKDAKVFIVTAEKSFMPVARRDERRIGRFIVEAPLGYGYQINEAARKNPDVLIIDRLDPTCMPAVLDSVSRGTQVFSQIDTVLRGAALERWLMRGIHENDTESMSASGLSWALSVQRVKTLCPACRKKTLPSAGQLEALRYLLTRVIDIDFTTVVGSAFYREGKCNDCNHTGRQSDAGVIDIYHAKTGTSVLPLEACLLHLALAGRLTLDDVFGYDEDRLYKFARRLEAVEHSLNTTSIDSSRKQIELESAQRVLNHRTQVLFSLEEFSQALINSNNLCDLADKVCKRACDLCGADKAILYFLNSPDQVAVLAIAGWDSNSVEKLLPIEKVFFQGILDRPISHRRIPPGIPTETIGDRKKELRCGLSVPLLAQNNPVGLLLVHSSQKDKFTPGEVAVLQTFTNQAAMALQRAGLINQLQNKVVQLEAAQTELARKERMERELELACQVQKSMLPIAFPKVRGFQFVARNQPARQVGGDFYDVISLDRQYLGIVIADVSDKGMPAALYMALTRSLLHAEAHRNLSPKAVLTSVNRLLLELGDQPMFVTVFYGVVDIAKKEMLFSRAGHDRPLLLRQGTVTELSGRGIALGVLGADEFYLSEEKITFVASDRLVLFTDGCTDVMNNGGLLYGLPRFTELIQRYSNTPSQEVCERLFSDLAAYHGEIELFDDMTLLIIDIR